jgi:hypothetical protein
LNIVSIFKIVNCWDFPPAIDSRERITIKYSTKINNKYQSFCFRKDALSNVDLILITAIYPDRSRVRMRLKRPQWKSGSNFLRPPRAPVVASYTQSNWKQKRQKRAKEAKGEWGVGTRCAFPFPIPYSPFASPLAASKSRLVGAMAVNSSVHGFVGFEVQSV